MAKWVTRVRRAAEAGSSSWISGFLGLGVVFRDALGFTMLGMLGAPESNAAHDALIPELSLALPFPLFALVLQLTANEVGGI